VLSVREILEKSSNVGMVRVSFTLKPSTLDDYIRRFGFGERTGIELPGEIRGLLAPVSQWSGVSAAYLSFGHEIGVTPLQLTSAFATVANDGLLVPPRIVVGTNVHDGELESLERPAPRRVLASRTAHAVASILEGVIARGTGRSASVPGYRIAGKTGTAQKVLPGGGYSDDLYVASFGGFASVRTPRVAAVVMLDSPRGDVHSGGAVAAPVFGRIMADALAYLRVPPDEDPLSVELPGAGERISPATYRPERARVDRDTATGPR
jgi:cell division protein FtsI/penicillin-binding protein 2